MNQSASEYLVVGKIGSTYGIHGWLKVYSFTEKKVDILDYNPWFLEEGQEWKSLEVKAGREHGKGVVVQLAGYKNPEEARRLAGKRIAIKRSQLPVLPKNEYYWTDLEGLNVVNQTGETLGKIIYLMETGSNDVLVIKHQGKEFAIPYLPGRVVTQVDLANQVIHVNWDLI